MVMISKPLVNINISFVHKPFSPIITKKTGNIKKIEIPVLFYF